MSAAVDQITFRDALDHVQDYLRANPSAYTQRLARQAVLSAMREMGHNHEWSYYYQLGRLNTNAPLTTGTISYDHTGGTYERMLVHTPGDDGETLPVWATFGHVDLAGVLYTVSEYRSPTIMQLSIHSNPGADIAAGTSFTLFRDCYVLPVDFVATDKMYSEGQCGWIDYVKPDRWLDRRRCSPGGGTPRFFTVKGSTDFQGCMEACFDPYPALAEKLDFIYMRRPRKVAVENYEVSTVSISAGTKIVTGSGTAFEDEMVGAIIRVSENIRDLPTSKVGDNVYEYERMVMQVNSATELIVDQNYPDNFVGVKYVISDVIDIEAGTMGTLFLRCLEAQIGKMARLSDRKDLQEEYLMQLRQAREADVRSFEPRSVGNDGWQRTLGDGNIGADET